MKDNLVEILKKILKGFTKTNQPDLVRIRLQSDGFLTEGECALINDCTMPTDKFLVMFNLLKAKDDETFKTLQRACIELKWWHLFSSLREMLEGAQRKDLLLSYSEQLVYHNIFTYGFQNPTPQFTGREQYLKEINDFFLQSVASKSANQETSSINLNNRILVISGSGGVGKSQLITAYMNKHKLDFDSIVWLNAESESALTASFYDLAFMLDIVMENSNLKKIIYNIFQKLLTFGARHLVIFDNADKVNREEIVRDIPHRICVLITSRHQSWPNAKVLILDVFTPEEAKNFVLQSLNIDEKENALKLTTTLHYFPLALQQATAYIKQMANLKTYTVEDFLIEYETNEKNTKKLLSYQIQKYNQDASLATTFAALKITFKAFTFEETLAKECETIVNESRSLLLKTFTTWKMIFNKIKDFFYKETNKETLPLKIIYIIAYLASDNIPTMLLLGDEKTEHLIWAVNVLKDFCLISVNNGFLRIHEMVQLVIRLHLSEENRHEEYLTTAIKLLMKLFPYDDKQLPAVKQKRILLPHLANVKVHLSKKGNGNIINKDKWVELNCSILERMHETYWVFGDVNNTSKVCEELLRIQAKHYGADHYKLAVTLTNLANAHRDLGDPQNSKSLLERALVIQERHFGSDHLQLAAILSGLAHTHTALGDPQTSKSLLERALAIQERHYGPDHFKLAMILSSLANAHRDLGDPQNSKSLLERALVIQEHHYGPDHFQLDVILANLANAYRDLGDSQNSKSLLERALVIQERHYGPDHFQLAPTLSNLANAHWDLGDPQNSKSLLEKALAIQERHYGLDHFQLAVILSNLANAHTALGDPQTSKCLLERALAIQERQYGPDHFQLAVTLSNLGNIYRELGDPKNSKRLLERALVIQERQYGPGHFLLAVMLSNLAIAQQQLGDPEDSKCLLERALLIQERHYGPDHFSLAVTLSNLANAHTALGDPQTSKSLLERALAIQERQYGPDHFQLAVTLSNLGNIYRELGDPKNSKRLLERALVIQERCYGPHHFQLAMTLSNLAIAQQQLGDPENSKSLLERALVIQERHYGPDHFQLPVTLSNLAGADSDLGDPQNSKSL